MNTAGAILVSLAMAGVALPASAAAPERWAGAWGYAPASAGEHDAPLPPGTYRYRVRLTQAGSGLMLTFSNAEGAEAVAIAAVSIGEAASEEGVAIRTGSMRPVRFSGSRGAALPPGRTMLSDAVDIAAEVGRDMIVSVTFSTPTRPARTNLGLPMAFAPGLTADDAPGDSRFERIQARAYLSLVSVRDPRANCTVVAFGDSITDGYLALSTETRGWPGRLSERLAALAPERRCGVVNMGISANRMLNGGRAVPALDRFWRDVASVPGVTHVVLLEGINDIGNSGRDGNATVDAAALVDGYRQFVRRAHALGIRVIGATITPALGAGYMSPEKERVRASVNDSIRTGQLFDGMVDFDAAVRDPANPTRLRPAFDPGDHLHPNDDGLRAMGEAIDLSLLKPSD
ncbi:SGNH/GDSL hydrolase family protein [Sphingomonas sp. IW22]|uniref:SGNH/GDSL hydrolase family protein n=1 Tax=Sphingomonas sp. IW22 TaxID=3242489 RepID=UPI0035208865